MERVSNQFGNDLGDIKSGASGDVVLVPASEQFSARTRCAQSFEQAWAGLMKGGTRCGSLR